MFEDESAGRYRKLVIADGKIAGAILLGSGAEASPVVTAVKRGYDVRGAAARAARRALGRARRAQRHAPAGAGRAGEPELGLEIAAAARRGVVGGRMSTVGTRASR